MASRERGSHAVSNWMRRVHVARRERQARRLGAASQKGRCVMSTDNRLRLDAILATMDVPPARLEDLRWLSRNLPFRNWQHPQFNDATALIAKLLREETTNTLSE